MLFSSPVFFIFFAAYFACHAILPARHRFWLIIVGGLAFYAYWRPAYVWIPIALVLPAFFGALWVDSAAPITTRRLRTGITVAILLLPLTIFKYTNFLYFEIFGFSVSGQGKILDLPLPLGISFITFTLIAYVVDVHRRRFPVEPRARMLASYMLFFPHLIAGPILRPHELIPQLDRPKPWRTARFGVGFAIFTVGLAKKLVFADQISEIITPVFSSPTGHGPIDVFVAIYGFSAQIYCDFSGYTDMAIGLALLMGVRLPNNFARPYLSASIVEFWRRWHITLSHWLRDYLYIPLGGSKFGDLHRSAAIMATMTLGGLWHGANWTFVLWGIMHGAAVVGTHMWRSAGPNIRLPHWVGIFITFHFVTFSWVFFRSANLAIAFEMLSVPFRAWPSQWHTELTPNAFVILLIAAALAFHRLDDHFNIRLAVRRIPGVLLWPALAFLWIISVAASAGSSAAFIYFDF